MEYEQSRRPQEATLFDVPSEMSNVIHFPILYIPNIHTYAYCTSHDIYLHVPACTQCCIFSIVRANFQKYDLYSAPIARALPRYIVPFFKFFKTGKCFKTMLFPVSCVSQKPLPFQKHSLLLIQPKTRAKTLSERSEKCATVQVLTGTDSVARATYLQRALGALWRELYQV